MPIYRYAACLHLLRCSKVADHRRLEAARYLQTYWGTLQGNPIRVTSSVLLDSATAIFCLTDDADERLRSACTLVVALPIDLDEGVRLEAARYVIDHVEQGSIEYDTACEWVARLDPDSDLAAELAQYLYDTSLEDEVASVAAEPGPITNIGIHADITLDNEGEATIRWGSTVDRAPPGEEEPSRPLTIPDDRTALPADIFSMVLEQAQWELMRSSPVGVTRYRGSCGIWRLIVGYRSVDEVGSFTRYFGEAWAQSAQYHCYHYLREDQVAALYRKASGEPPPVRASRYERDPVI